MNTMLNAAPTNLQAIPHGFQHFKQFINWRIVPDIHKPGKTKKLPCDLYGKVIDPHDPTHWLTGEEAARSIHGIGFVFTANDPFWFIDIDAAFDGVKWSDWSHWCAQYFAGCSIEVSHSGTGLHLFGCGSGALPPDHGCKNTTLGVELYTSGRFVALTGRQKAGDAWIDYGDRLRGFVVHAGLTLSQGVQDAENDAETAEGPDPRYTGPADDAALLALMCGSTGSISNMFGSRCHPADLWNCNRAALAVSYPAVGTRDDGASWDWSAADAALMWHLSFWTGRDRDRMVRLFEMSKLYRPDKYTGKGAYRLKGILKQGFRNHRVYDRPGPGLAAPPASPGAVGASEGQTAPERGARSTMDLQKQVEHFAGCVYVQAAHAIMVPDGRLLRPAVFNAVYGGWSFQMQYDHGRPSHEAFKAFTESRMMRFPSVVDTCFRPDREPSEVIDGRINTWRLPVVDEEPGDITAFLNHLVRLVPDQRDRSILLTYMQSLARNPGKKFQWAPVIQGTQGNGKSLILRALYHAITKAYSHLPKASQLTEKFNSWLERRIFIGVEEIKVTDRREVLEDLKDAVTNDWVEIRGMNQDKRMADNYTNWVFCTNYKDAIPVNRDERRYAIFFTAQQSVDDLKRDGMDEVYFHQLYAWLRGGGYKRVAYWLRHSPIVAPEFDPAELCQRAPSTSSTVEAINVSLGRVEQTILEAVENEESGFKGGWISTGAVRRYLQSRGVRDVGARKMGEIIQSLGYEHRFKSTVQIIEEENQRSHVYRKITVAGGTQLEFLIAQTYHYTLQKGSVILTS
jgi:hypothetical protein